MRRELKIQLISRYPELFYKTIIIIPTNNSLKMILTKNEKKEKKIEKINVTSLD